MKKFSAWKSILGTLLLLGFVSNSWAGVGSTVSLVPTSPTTDLVDGDPVTFDVIIDFSAEGGTLGGGFDVVFDPTAFSFVGLTSAGLGDPGFERLPDILSGRLRSWAVGDFNGISITGPGTVGSVEFQVLPTMGAATTVSVTEEADGIVGPWVSQIIFQVQNPEYNQVDLTRLVDPDSDSDGVGDSADNCTDVANPDQRDTDGDGHGNVCDADLNNDCIVNAIDLGFLRSVFFTTDPDADFNGDGIVNVIDLGIFRTFFFAPPGPSAPALCPL